MTDTTKPTMETIRGALYKTVNAPCTCNLCVDSYSAVLYGAIDELATLRESDAELRARVETLTQQFQQAAVDAGMAHEKAAGARILAAGLEEQVQALTEGRSEDEAMLAAQHRKVLSLIGELDAAKADAARLRATLRTIKAKLGSEDRALDDYEPVVDIDAALAAPDSVAWLAKHDAEVTEPLRQRIAELEESVGGCDDESACGACSKCVAELTDKLTAAINDAARAELRARDAVAAVKQVVAAHDARRARHDGIYGVDWASTPDAHAVGQAFATALHVLVMESTAPDSDARLREVIWRAAQLGAAVGSTMTLEEIVDEVLGVKS